MNIYLLHETYYTPNEDIISSNVIKAYICQQKAEQQRQSWEDSNDDERAEYSVEEIELVDEEQ